MDFRTSRVLLFVTASALVLAGCQDLLGDKSEKKSPETAGGEEIKKPDDDGEVEDAIPMALFDGAPLLSYVEKGLDGVGFESIPARKTAAELLSAATNTDKVNFAFSVETIALPDRAERHLVGATRVVKDLLDRLYGPTGVFKGADLKIGVNAGKGRKVFKVQEGGATKYVAVDVDLAREFPYAADFYSEINGSFVRTQWIEARRDAGGRRARISQLTDIGDAVKEALVRIEYDEVKRSVTSTINYLKLSSTRPGTTKLIAVDDPTRAERFIQGAVIWEFDEGEPPSGIEPPRYYAPRSGDTELFQSIRPLERVGSAAGAHVYLRIEERLAGLISGSLVAKDYLHVMLGHLTEVVMSDAVNGNCATSGSLIRKAFQDQSIAVPEEVESLPSNLCFKSLLAPKAEAVSSALAASCDAGVNLALDVVFSNAGAQRYYLCNKYWEAKLLTNPVFTTLDQSGVRKVSLPEDPKSSQTVAASEAHADQGNRTVKAPWIDPKPLFEPLAPTQAAPLSPQDAAAATAFP